MSKCFLATTAIEECWDTGGPILFLGDWCRLYSRRLFLQELDYRVMVSPFQTETDRHNAYIYVSMVYEKILPIVSEILNNVHQTDYSHRYWRILVGPWLRDYIATVYDRFIHISSALEQYPDLTTIVLSKEEFVVPLDTVSFKKAVSGDLYNLQLYSKIFLFFEKDFPSKSIEANVQFFLKKPLQRSLRKYLVSSYNFFCRLVLQFTSPPLIVFNNSYFSRWVEFYLSIRSFGRFAFERGRDHFYPNSRQYDTSMRDYFKSITCEDSFSKCLVSMLYSDLPKCFLEDYQAIRKIGQSRYPDVIDAIFSANGWYYDEVFKSWAAERSENGTLLMGVQHGGRYGMMQHMDSLDHEVKIVDRYYSWGWKIEDFTDKIIPMPSVKLIKRRKIGANNSKKGILLVTTTYPRYLDRSFELPSAFKCYIKWVERFSKALPRDLQALLCVRPHYQDFKWDLKLRLKSSIPDIVFDSWDNAFLNSLKKNKLYVCDHLSTTLLEALSANQPTILFFNAKDKQFLPEAEHFLKMLREGGILFDSPEAAAMEVGMIYDDIESWWNNPDRQKIISSFCDQYCQTSNNAIDLWIDELNKVCCSVKRQ